MAYKTARRVSNFLGICFTVFFLAFLILVGTPVFAKARALVWALFCVAMLFALSVIVVTLVWLRCPVCRSVAPGIMRKDDVCPNCKCKINEF